MTLAYELREERHVGIEVDVGGGRVRPIWRMIMIRIPDGEITTDRWDDMTFTEKRVFLNPGAAVEEET